MKKAEQDSRRAPIVASAVALVLVAIKLSVGWYAGAMVVIASAVDSGLDFLISLFNWFAIHNARKPSDELFNYGRGKIKAVASLMEGLFIALSALFILLSAGYKLYQGIPVTHTVAAVWVMAISAVITGLLVIYLGQVARKTGDMVVKADALHYRVDVLTNLGVLLALFLIQITGAHWIDPIISMVIAIYILIAAKSLIKDGLLMLLDRALDDELTARIETILKTAETRVTGFHLFRSRQADNHYFVEYHLVFDAQITLEDAHRASDRIEKQIKALEPERSWVINCHMDPYDDRRKDLKDLAL